MIKQNGNLHTSKNFIINFIFVFSFFITSIYAMQGEEMKISIVSNGNTTVFKLNNSQAPKELFAQLPMSIEVENFGNNEKIFYPPQKLSTNNTPVANAKNGTLAYYAPWGDVVMFYKDFGSASGLYELGYVVSGLEYISQMSGIIKIEKVD